MTTKKSLENSEKTNSSIEGKSEVPGFTELLGRFERTVSVWGVVKHVQQLL